jgi:DNA-binding GntR family transcriptional regulator
VESALGLEKLTNDTLSERVHRALRLSILSGDLEAGRLLCIEELAKDLGVSTTPVREALVRLAADGLVGLQRNRQPVVASISTDEIAQVYAIRRLIEPYCGQRLAARAYKDASTARSLDQLRKDIVTYLEVLSSASEEPAVYGEYTELERRLQETLFPSSSEADLMGKIAVLVNNYVYRLRIFSREASKKDREARIRAVCVEHLRILDTLLEGDVPGVERAILDHLTHSEERSLAARRNAAARTEL